MDNQTYSTSNPTKTRTVQLSKLNHKPENWQKYRTAQKSILDALSKYKDGQHAEFTLWQPVM